MPGNNLATAGAADPISPQAHTSYTILNSPSSTEQQIEEEIERVANGLFSVVATLGLLYITKFLFPDTQYLQVLSPSSEHPKAMQQKWWPRNWKSRFEMLSLPLHVLRTPQILCLLRIPQVYQISSGHVCHNVPFLLNRHLIANTVLLILDRNVDLTSVISHGWTYQALLSDCFSMKLNRVIVPEGQKNQRYDLDNKDFFWSRNSASPFPQVAEEIDMELNRYKQDAAEITKSTGISDVDDISKLWARKHTCIRFSLTKFPSETFLPTPPTSRL